MTASPLKFAGFLPPAFHRPALRKVDDIGGGVSPCLAANLFRIGRLDVAAPSRFPGTRADKGRGLIPSRIHRFQQSMRRLRKRFVCVFVQSPTPFVRLNQTASELECRTKALSEFSK